MESFPTFMVIATDFD